MLLKVQGSNTSCWWNYHRFPTSCAFGCWCEHCLPLWCNISCPRMIWTTNTIIIKPTGWRPGCMPPLAILEQLMILWMMKNPGALLSSSCPSYPHERNRAQQNRTKNRAQSCSSSVFFWQQQRFHFHQGHILLSLKRLIKLRLS